LKEKASINYNTLGKLVRLSPFPSTINEFSVSGRVLQLAISSPD